MMLLFFPERKLEQEQQAGQWTWCAILISCEAVLHLVQQYFKAYVGNSKPQFSLRFLCLAGLSVHTYLYFGGKELDDLYDPFQPKPFCDFNCTSDFQEGQRKSQHRSLCHWPAKGREVLQIIRTVNSGSIGTCRMV